jgi:hypothetical protein
MTMIARSSLKSTSYPSLLSLARASALLLKPAINWFRKTIRFLVGLLVKTMSCWTSNNSNFTLIEKMPLRGVFPLFLSAQLAVELMVEVINLSSRSPESETNLLSSLKKLKSKILISASKNS